jgi:hypothetical protein
LDNDVRGFVNDKTNSLATMAVQHIVQTSTAMKDLQTSAGALAKNCLVAPDFEICLVTGRVERGGIQSQAGIASTNVIDEYLLAVAVIDTRAICFTVLRRRRAV